MKSKEGVARSKSSNGKMRTTRKSKQIQRQYLCGGKAKKSNRALMKSMRSKRATERKKKYKRITPFAYEYLFRLVQIEHIRYVGAVCVVLDTISTNRVLPWQYEQLLRMLQIQHLPIWPCNGNAFLWPV